MIMTPWNYPQPDFQPVNLSDPEVLDWTYWGLSSNTSVDRKSGAGIIGSLSVVGPDVPTQDQNCFDEFTWNDGDQNPSVPIACAGLMVSNTGDGYQFTVPADRTPKTLKVYIGIEGATARLEAHLSDASASAYVDSSLITDGAAAATYIIDFQAGSPGQTLTVTYTLDQLDWGEVTIEAAVLAPKHPSVAITQPTPGQAFTAPAMFTAIANASQVAATLDNVSLLQDGNSLLTLTSPPFNFDVSGLAAGNYQLTAQALDSNNLTQTSDPVPIHIVGSGGELTATIAAPPGTVDLTQQGTADWILFGRDVNVDVDRKANVAPLIHTTTEPSIGGVSLIDWAYSYFYDDNLITYAAEDGNNQFAPVTCGIFLPNPGSGFEFAVDAGTAERTVNIYLGAYRAQGKLEAYLSDGSAVPFVDTSTDSGATNVKNQVYSLTYHAASAGQKLIVRYTLLSNHDYGNVTLQAITVNGAPRPLPSITSVSHASDPRGTLIWIYGANFGTTFGTVLFNGIPAQVLYWSDTAIEVSVPPGATSGPIVVSTDGASSNGLNFTVTDATPPGPPATIAPAQVSLFVGDTRKFQALDSSGRLTTASSWTSSDTSIADFGPDPNDPTGTPILTAKVSGQLTINADSATATVTVYPEGTSFPAGTVVWSVPGASTGGGSGAFTVQAMPAPSSLADLFIVQPSGLVQALKADGTPVWHASLGFNAGHALPDSNGGIVGFNDGTSPMTRIDSSGSPTWSIPPADYNYRAENIAVHPDGTIFILGTLKNPPEGASTITYVVGINGLTGAEKFRVPVITSEQVPNMILEDVQPSVITIAPDGNAYLEHVLETGSRTQQNFDVSTIIDATSTASLRIMKIASDGTYVDTEIQSWSSSYHEDDEFSDNGTTEVATYSFSPAQLPEFSLKEIIPDNHGNLLASWSYWVPGWTQTCTTTGRNSQQQSTTCTGEVPGQDSQAHVGLLSLLTGINLENDFTLSGVDYFTGPMVMGQLDTAFVTGAKNVDSLNRIAAFNAVSGQRSWSTPGTADYIEPIGATADGGIAVKDFPNSGGNVSVLRYDSNGNQSNDPALPAVDLQYLASDAWITTMADGSQTAIENAAVDWALSPWDSPRGPQRPAATADPKIKIQLNVSNLYVNTPEDIQTNSAITTKVNNTRTFWWTKAKIQIDWDGTILPVKTCDPSLYPNGCSGNMQADIAEITSQTTASEFVRRFCIPNQLPKCTSNGIQLAFNLDEATAQGYTPFTGSTSASTFMNLSAVARSALEDAGSDDSSNHDVSHEIGHEFQLHHLGWSLPSNLMCTGILPSFLSGINICPNHAGGRLASDQIVDAQKGAARYQ